MKTILLAGTSLLAFSSLLATARADTIGYTGSLASYSVTATGEYEITATGGSGGASHSFFGGYRAVVSGDFALSQGETLSIAVGGAGASGFVGGGGGGSFVTLVVPSLPAGSVPLIIAGGGGGGALFAGGNGGAIATSVAVVG
jgi:hypothetical protein